MRDKLVNSLMLKISENNKDLTDVKLSEIKYGLQGLYTLVTKSFVIFSLAIILNIFYEFIIFLIFYSILRGVGYGVHAKSNLACWIYSTLLLLGIPYFFNIINISKTIKILLWEISFLNFLIFSPADTKKRPMINKKRKLKFKLLILVFSLIYLILILSFNNISNLIIGAMFLEGLLVNPLGYILMGEKVRFSLNDIYI